MNRILLSVVGATLAAPTALAQFALTVPDAFYATHEGNSNFTGPWNFGAAGGRVQFAHDSTVFTNQGVTTPIRISRLRYRADAIQNTWSGGTYPSVQIAMSTCPFNYLSVSNTFANNHGPDMTVVLNGAVTVIGGGGGNAPSGWYVDIALTTPFVYDPTTGNDLLVDFTVQTGFTGGSGIVDHVGPGGTPAALGSRVWIAGTPGSPTGNASFSPTFGYSPVCEFTYAPATGLWPNFDATPPTGPTPLVVQFNDRSVTDDPAGISAWQWDLNGDNVIDSTLQNPTFTYTSCGSYTVSLTVIDGVHGLRTLTRNNFMVTDTVKANFTYAVQTNGTVTFTDTSVPTPTSWAWDLNGDSVTDSTAQNPIWAYGPGCHALPVTLTANRACGPTDTSRKMIVVAANSVTTQLTTAVGTFVATTGNLFDLQVLNPAGINICAVTCCPYGDGTLPTGSPINCSFYVTDAAGGYNANHSNAAVWRLAATGNGFYTHGNVASPSPTIMAFDHPVYLVPGTYGIAVYMNVVGMAYGAGAVTRTNNDLTLTAGSSKFGVFSATQTASRSWSGTLHYDTLQTGGSAGFGFFGAGCTGSLGIAGQSFTGVPQIGGALNVTVNNLPQSVMGYLTGLSRTNSAFGPLPLDTTSLGMPGCLGRVSPDLILFSVGAGNTASITFHVPANPVLSGLNLYTQPLPLDPGFNGLGATLGDAWAMLIGI